MMIVPNGRPSEGGPGTTASAATRRSSASVGGSHVRWLARETPCDVPGTIGQVHPRFGEAQQPQLVARFSGTFGKPQRVERVRAIILFLRHGSPHPEPCKKTRFDRARSRYARRIAKVGADRVTLR